jgi:acyl-homoserine lactone synthase
MIQAHVVGALNRHLYEAELDEFFRRRHDFFVRQKQWRPASPDGREVDQYDTDAATYLLGMEDGAVVASARLIATTEPHLVSDFFSDMCELRGVPRRSDYFEWTRTFTLRRERGLGVAGLFAQICCAVMEYAVDENLAAVGGVMETYALRALGRFGWRVRHMGLARERDGEYDIVAYIDVNDAALAGIRQLLGIEHSLLIRRGPQRPLIEQSELRL